MYILLFVPMLYVTNVKRIVVALVERYIIPWVSPELLEPVPVKLVRPRLNVPIPGFTGII